MDAAAADADVKLYKASAELLAELQEKLPLLLHAPDGTARKWLLLNKASMLAHLEWPQLLDPILADVVHKIVEAFLMYCMHYRDVYACSASINAHHIEPLPRALCRMLYVFCKVRGYKVIVRLLNNEPKYIEPLLVCYQTWSQSQDHSPSRMSWEERYIMLLWLSHLMLAPFELATISGFSSAIATLPETFETTKLPAVAEVLLAVAFQRLCVSSKDREGASHLIVRLALREDMRRLQLPGAIMKWCTNELKVEDENAIADQYRHVGLLTLLFGLTNSSSSTEAAPFVEHLFDTCDLLSSSPDPAAVAARQSAPSRKLIIKTMRSSILHTVTLADANNQKASNRIEAMLESGIQALLEWLADSDTPVRQAASKALGMIILKLDSDMAGEVIEAVLGCLNENMLLEDRRTGQLIAVTDTIDIDLKQYKKNVNAVDALKWHGAMLTLGHVLFRRSPPPEQLSVILEALLVGLTFEQRSNVGTSLGVGVRDAACFGIWSLARKYTTSEVDAAILPAGAQRNAIAHKNQSTLQMVATELVVASCLDPSGNLRRGASAALQELIGRHPDTILEGIAVVQRVDYHSVARRSTALVEVTEAVSLLGEVYHENLLSCLLDWRGCRAVDADSRHRAADIIGKLFWQAQSTARLAFLTGLVSQIGDLRLSNTGVNAATRHGLLLAFAAILEARPSTLSANEGLLNSLRDVLLNINKITGTLSGRVTADLADVLDAISKLIGAAVKTVQDELSASEVQRFIVNALPILDRCTLATEDGLLSTTAAQANVQFFVLLDMAETDSLLKSWLPADFPKQRTTYTCRGRILSLSLLFPLLMSDSTTVGYARRIAMFLASIVSSTLAIETKVSAIEGISTILRSGSCSNTSIMSLITEAISFGLSDYTVDQRGDVGSLLRLVSIASVQQLDFSQLDRQASSTFIRAIVRLSAEKLTKVRFAAWNVLQPLLSSYLNQIQTLQDFDHQADISSVEYYRQLCELLKVQWLHDDLVRGLVSSIAGGADDISQTACNALISFLAAQNDRDLEQHLQRIINLLLRQLLTLSKREDREVVPPLDTLCLIMEQFAGITQSLLNGAKVEILALVNDLQTPIADIPRIQSLLRLLSCLSSIDDSRQDAADKISRKLLHKWPKVRQAAADAAFMLAPEVMPVAVDWNMPLLTNKDKVIELRKALGVAGRATAKA